MRFANTFFCTGNIDAFISEVSEAGSVTRCLIKIVVHNFLYVLRI